MDVRARMLDGRPDQSDPVLGRALANLRMSLGPAPLQGRYLPTRRIGDGGFGTVWAAFDPRLEREVAIKILTRNLGEADLSLLLREAQALAALSHPNVVACFDVGLTREAQFLAMELVDGCDLAHWLAEPRTPRAILDVFAGAAAGIAAAHRIGIVHRDVKPGNILVGRDGRARVTDFGVARVTTLPSTDASEGAQSVVSSGVIGTLLYMPPEQHDGRSDSTAVDVFALAASLYEAFAGVPAFQGRDAETLREHKLAQVIAPPAPGRKVPGRVLDAVLAGLDPDPEARPSIEALIAAAQPRRHSGVLWFGAAASAAAIWSALGTASPEADPCASAPMPAAIEPELASTLQAQRAAFSSAKATTCDAFAHGVLARVDRDVRLQCLARRQDDLERLARAFDPRSATLADELQAIVEFPGPEACVHTGEPEDPMATAVDAWLVRARAALAVEDHATARAHAAAALAIADVAGDPRLQSEALVVRGIASSVLTDRGLAHDDLVRGFWLATSVGEDRIATEAAVWLVPVTRAVRADRGDSLPWERSAEAGLQRLGGAPALAARLEQHLATNAAEIGDAAAAMAASDRAMAWWDQLAPADSAAQINPLLARAGVLRSAGRLDDAIAVATRARDLAIAHAGPDDAMVYLARARMANVQVSMGRAREGLAAYREIVPALASRLGPADARTDTARMNLAKLLILEGEFADAKNQLVVLVADADRTFGPRHPLSAARSAELAHVEQRLGEHDAARLRLLASAEVFDAGPFDLRSLATYGALASAAAQARATGQARAWMAKSFAVVQALLPEDHATRLEISGRFAIARISDEPSPEAFAAFEAIRERVRALGLEALGAELDLSYGIEVRRLDRFTEAAAVDASALAYFEARGTSHQRARAEYSLANSLDGQGRDPERVLALRQRACRTFREPPTADAGYTAECDLLGIR